MKLVICAAGARASAPQAPRLGGPGGPPPALGAAGENFFKTRHFSTFSERIFYFSTDGASRLEIFIDFLKISMFTIVVL